MVSHANVRVAAGASGAVGSPGGEVTGWRTKVQRSSVTVSEEIVTFPVLATSTVQVIVSPTANGPAPAALVTVSSGSGASTVMFTTP